MKFGSKFLFTKIEASKRKILNLFQYFLQRVRYHLRFSHQRYGKKESLYLQLGCK